MPPVYQVGLIDKFLVLCGLTDLQWTICQLRLARMTYTQIVVSPTQINFTDRSHLARHQPLPESRGTWPRNGKTSVPVSWGRAITGTNHCACAGESSAIDNRTADGKSSTPQRSSKSSRERVIDREWPCQRNCMTVKQLKTSYWISF
jgi:hypothetical protein